VFFSDIRDFTATTEAMALEETFEFINDYLAAMEPPRRARGGFIDKYIGDAVMALFDGPADDAVQAAVDSFQALQKYNTEAGQSVAIGFSGRVADEELRGGRPCHRGQCGTADARPVRDACGGSGTREGA